MNATRQWWGHGGLSWRPPTTLAHYFFCFGVYPVSTGKTVVKQDFNHKPLLCRLEGTLLSDSAVLYKLGSPPYFEPEQVEFFEPFWDSGEPRAGEKGARGWRAWMHQQERGGWVVISPGKAPLFRMRTPLPSSGMCFHIFLIICLYV